MSFATVLNNAGQTGPVTVNVRDGVYTEQFMVSNIQGNSFTNTLTIQGESGDSSLVTLEYSDVTNVIFEFNRVKGLFLADLCFKSLNTPWTGGEAYKIVSCDTVRISNCLFKSSASQSYYMGQFYINGSRGVLVENNNFNDNAPIYIYSSATGYSDVRILNNSNIKGYWPLNIVSYSYHLGMKAVLKGNSFSRNGYDKYNAVMNGSLDTLIFEGNSLLPSSDGDYNFSMADGGLGILKNNTFEGRRLKVENIDSIISNRFLGVENENALYINSGSSFIANNYISLSGALTSTGLYVRDISGVKIVNNSIENIGTSASSYGLRLEAGATNITVKNNIFSTKNGGVPVQVPSALTNPDWDYNCYYTSGNIIGSYNGTNYSSVSALGAAMGSDANSLNVNPFFMSDTNLTTNQGQLKAGISIAGVTTDIDGTARGNPSTIGAKEYAGCNNDAGINRVIHPTSPLSSTTNNIEVELSNQGTGGLFFARIGWSVNDVLQTPYNWSGNLSSQNTTNVTIANNHTFSGASIYNLKAWIETVNGSADCNAYNDTTLLENLVTPLNGVYTLGGVNPDFASFSELATVLNNAGQTGPVTVNVRDGVYTEQFMVSNIQGNSFTNTLTIQGESGDSSLVTLEYSDVTNVIFEFNRVKGLFLADLCFKSLNTPWTGGEAYKIVSCDTVRISNCLFKSSASQSYYMGQFYINGSRGVLVENNNFNDNAPIYIYSSATGYSDVRILNNSNIKGYWPLNIVSYSYHLGMKAVLKGNSFSRNGYDKYNAVMNGSLDTLIFEGNSLLPSSDGDYNFSMADGGLGILKNNTFEGRRLKVENIDSIISNRFLGVENENALYINSGSSFIANNYISLSGALTSTGLYVRDISGVKIVNNSIENIGTSASSYGLRLEAGATNITVKNNIFSTKNGGVPVQVPSALTNPDWDYNCYYTSGNIIGSYNGTNYSSVSALGAAMGSDANSLNVNPYFVSDTNLMVSQRQLNGAGIYVPGVNVDIDNEVRNASAPDIGAQEFDIDFGLLELLQPTLSCLHTSSEAIEVRIKQYGDAAVVDMQIAYQVNGGAITTETINGTTFSDIDYTFTATEDLAAIGNYVFKMWLVNSSDDNLNNDTLTTTIFRSNVPTSSFSYVPSCANELASFTGTATVASGSISSYEWILGDGNTSTIQNPNHCLRYFWNL